MSKSEAIDRMKELMIPIDTAIMNCDNNRDILLLASVMLSTAKTMYKTVLGEEGANEVIRGIVKE
jgi:hypothetical protein